MVTFDKAWHRRRGSLCLCFLFLLGVMSLMSHVNFEAYGYLEMVKKKVKWTDGNFTEDIREIGSSTNSSNSDTQQHMFSEKLGLRFLEALQKADKDYKPTCHINNDTSPNSSELFHSKEAVQAYLSLKDYDLPLWMIGDSVGEQYTGTLWVAENADLSLNVHASTLNMTRVPHTYMLPQSKKEIQFLFTTIQEDDATKDLYQENQPMNGPGHDAILLFNIGLWYNLRCSSEYWCLYEDYHVDELLKMWQQDEIIPDTFHGFDHLDIKGQQNPEQIDDKNFSEQIMSPYYFVRRRDHPSQYKRNTTWPPERIFARDMILMIDWLRRHRAFLPKYIFWLGTTPQHYPGPGLFYYTSKRMEIWNSNASIDAINVTGSNGCQIPENISVTTTSGGSSGHYGPPPKFWYWQDDVATKILSTIMPEITFIPSSTGPLEQRPQDHPGGRDCTHFCVSSDGWISHFGTVMKSIVNRINEEDFEQRLSSYLPTYLQRS